MEQISEIMHRQQTRQNWNFFVGDSRFKTNFLLQFPKKTISRLYSSWLFSGSLYSIRMWLTTLYAAYISTKHYYERQSRQETHQLGTFANVANESEIASAIVIIEIAPVWNTLLSLLYFASFAAGMLATFKRSWSLQTKQLILSILPLLVLVRQLELYYTTLPADDPLNFTVRAALLTPSFITYLLIVEDWSKYLTLTCGHLLLASLVFGSGLSGSKLDLDSYSTYDLVANMSYIVPAYVLAFSIFEKVSKERFVVNQTNQQTRKLLGELINSGCVIVTMSPEGRIFYFNEAFRFFITNRLHRASLPDNIYKIFGDQTGEKEQLEELVREVCGREGRAQVDSRSVIEVRIPRDSSSVEADSNGEGQELRSFEMVRISCQMSLFSGGKCLILSIESINDYEGHAQLVVQQAHQLQAYLQSFEQCVEQCMHDEPVKVTESKHHQESFKFVAKSVRNPHYLYHCLRQIDFQVKLVGMLSVAQTLWYAHKTEVDFLFGKNLLQCFESCSNMMNDHAEFTFVHDEGLPEVVKGDIDLLMLLMHSLTEFALKYSSCEEQIVMRTNFDGKTEEDKLMVGFRFSILVNPAFDTEKILEVLNVNDPFGQGTTTEDINVFFQQRAFKFSAFVEEFGIGLLTLPCLVHLLDGTIKSEVKQVKKKLRGAGQGSSVRSYITANNNDGNEADKQQQLLVSLLLPLTQSELETSEGFKVPMLMPQEMSNRQSIHEGTTSWISPRIFRRKQELLQRNKEEVAGRTQLKGECAKERTVNERPTTSQTPKLNVRHIDRDMIYNHRVSRQNSVPLSDDDQKEHLQRNQSNGGVNQHERYFASRTLDEYSIDQQIASCNGTGSIGDNSFERQSLGTFYQQSSLDKRSSNSFKGSTTSLRMMKKASQEGQQIQASVSMMQIPVFGQSDAQQMFQPLNKVLLPRKTESEDSIFIPDNNLAVDRSNKSSLNNSVSSKAPSDQGADRPDGQSRLRSVVSDEMLFIARETQKQAKQVVSTFGQIEANQNDALIQSPPKSIPENLMQPAQSQGSMMQPLVAPQPYEVGRIVEEEKKEPPAVQTFLIDTTGRGRQEPVQKQLSLKKLPSLTAEEVRGEAQSVERPPNQAKEDEESFALLGENMPSLYLDELIPGRDLKKILKDRVFKDKLARPREEDGQQSQKNDVDDSEESDEDDDEVELTEEQKLDLKERKKRLMKEYHSRLALMRSEELAKKEELLRRKAQALSPEQHDGDIPIARLHYEDHLGGEASKLQAKGATNQLLLQANASRMQLRRNGQPAMPSPQTKPDRKLEHEKFNCDLKFREIQRRLWEQDAIIKTQKDYHEQIKPLLVEEVEAEVPPRVLNLPQIEEEKIAVALPVPAQASVAGSSPKAHMSFTGDQFAEYVPQRGPVDERAEAQTPAADQSQLLNLGSGVDCSMNQDDSVSDDSQSASPSKVDKQRIVLEGEDAQNLIRIQQLDLQKLNIPKELTISLRNVQTVLQTMQISRRRSSNELNQGRPRTCSSDLSLNKEEVKEEQAGSQPTFRSSNSADAAQANEKKPKIQDRRSELDQLDISTPPNLGGYCEEEQKGFPSPANQNKSLARSEENSSSDQLRHQEFIMMKQASYVASLQENFGPIEEEKSQFQSQSSWSNQRNSKFDDGSQWRANSNEGSERGIAPVQLGDLKRNFVSPDNSGSLSELRNSNLQEQSSFSGQGVENGTNQKFYLTGKKRHLSSKQVSNSLNSSLLMGMPEQKLNLTVNIEEEKKENNSFSEVLAQDGSVNAGRFGWIRDLRSQRRRSQYAAEIVKQRVQRDRSILKDQCQKHATGDSFFLEQQLQAKDREASGTTYRWTLADIQRRKEERQRTKPKCEERKDDDDDEDDDNVTLKRNSRSLLCLSARP